MKRTTSDQPKNSPNFHITTDVRRFRLRQIKRKSTPVHGKYFEIQRGSKYQAYFIRRTFPSILKRAEGVPTVAIAGSKSALKFYEIGLFVLFCHTDIIFYFLKKSEI